MSEINRSRHQGRPSAITLILSAPNQTDLVLRLLQHFSTDYGGTILVAQEPTAEACAQLANTISPLIKLEVRALAGRVSLNRGKVYLVQSDVNYAITAADQIEQVVGTVHTGHTLFESLVERFPDRTRVVVLSTIYSAQLNLVDLAARRQVNLLTLESIRTIAPSLFSELADTYSVKDCSGITELFTEVTAPTIVRKRQTSIVSSSDLDSYEQILKLLKERKKFDFSEYKEASLLTRIEHHLKRLRLSGLPEYTERLRVDERELDRLHTNLFIGMTRFFRDTAAFIELQRQLSSYVEKAGARRLSIWSAGCSTGAEPYSLALVCDLIRRTRFPELNVEICATDSDPQAIAVANNGCYSREEIERIPAEYLPTHLEHEAEKYDLRGAVETEVRFEQHDLLTPPTGSDFDLIVCRNVFIYFAPTAQERILNNFHQCLKRGGLLMLGRSESTGTGQTQFKALSESAKIYKALQLSPSS